MYITFTNWYFKNIHGCGMRRAILTPVTSQAIFLQLVVGQLEKCIAYTKA